MIRAILALLLLGSSAALAQAPAPQKDRKDYLLEALQAQRDDGLAKAAVCYADANSRIADLEKQLAAAKAELIETRKPAIEKPAKP